MKHRTTATLLLALLLMATALPALASNQGASPADIALWQTQAPAPQGEFQKIITVLGDQSAPTIHRRLASSQRGPVIDNSPRGGLIPIRMTAAAFWATLRPDDFTYMIDLQQNPDGLFIYVVDGDQLAVWAGNRIFQTQELIRGQYMFTGYNPVTDDFYDPHGPRYPLDELIDDLKNQGSAIWTRLY